MRFFKMVNGELELDRDEILLYSEFAKILRRDRGSDGDADGRKKLRAYKEFKYIYHTTDFNAYPTQNGLSELAGHKYALQEAGLELTYKPDEEVKAAIKRYAKEHLSIAKNTVKSILRIFGMNDTIISSIENNIQYLLSTDTLNKEQIAELINYQKSLLDIAVNVPQQAVKLRETMNIVEDEERKQKEVLYGGGEVDESMNPDNEIERD